MSRRVRGKTDEEIEKALKEGKVVVIRSATSKAEWKPKNPEKVHVIKIEPPG